MITARDATVRSRLLWSPPPSDACVVVSVANDEGGSREHDVVVYGERDHDGVGFYAFHLLYHGLPVRKVAARMCAAQPVASLATTGITIAGPT